jgi:hypothetical protein
MAYDTENRGLPSLAQARAERRRAMLAGQVRLRAMAPIFWLWTGIGLVLFAVVYWWLAERDLQSQKAALMAKQRAVVQSLGPRIFPFRDAIEKWTIELAGTWRGDQVAPGTNLLRVRTSPGVYLRLRLKNALDPKKIAEAAGRSLHDGFTSCFFMQQGAPDPRKGRHCETPGQCEPGLLCNEWDVCAPPPRPYNMRLAYRALRVLSGEWIDALHEAGTDLAVRMHERDLESVTKNDVPIAIEVLSRAKYFTVVLDEDPTTGLPGVAKDAGLETEEERIQRAPHEARVGIWDLRSHQLVLRVRRQASGSFVPVGDRVVRRAETIAAQQRQANSCALALAVISAAESQEHGASAGAAAPAEAERDAGPGTAEQR